MDSTSSITEAIRQALARARSEASASAPCEVCGAPKAAPYAFAYARVVAKTSETTPTATTTRTYYDSVGSRVVWLCERCIAPTRRRLAARPLWLAAVVDGALLLFGIILVRARGWDFVLPMAVAAFLLTLVFYMQRRRVLGDLRVPGQSKARELHESQLRAQGYDAFWSDPGEV